jgi:SAM-dependent methyltransferase
MPNKATFRDQLRYLRANPRAVLRRHALQLYCRITDAPYEIRYGVNTTAIVDAHADGEQHQCEPIPYVTLNAVARHMAAHPGPRRCFADIGCGLGRPLYYFASRFETLRGYEIAQPVHDAARAQLERVQQHNTDYRKIAFANADAAAAVPLGVPLTLLLYNPFGPATMARLCERLAQSKSDIRIYYAYPAHADVVARALGAPADRFHRLVDITYFHIPGAA